MPFLDRFDPVFVLAAMSVVAFAIRLFPLFLRPDQLARFVADDGYMYFKLAQNIAAGKGATFDGVTKTNGFHPLYALLLVPIFKIFRNDLHAPIRAAVVLLAAFNVATVGFIYSIVVAVAGPWPAVFASAVWLFNPWVIYVTVECLEAPIWVFFASAASWAWVWMKLHGYATDVVWLMALGVVVGIAFLARTEAILLTPTMALDIAWTNWADGWAPALTRVVVFGAVVLVVFSPWLVWCWRNFRRLTQVSGDILSYKHHADMVDGSLMVSAGKLAVLGAANIVASFNKMLGAVLGERIVTVAFASVVAGVLLAGQGTEVVEAALPQIGFLELFLVVHVLFYGGWMWRYQDWYFLSPAFAGAVLCGVGAKVLEGISVAAGADGLVTAGVALLAIFAVTGVWAAVARTRPIEVQQSLYHAALWVRDNTAKDAVIATINTGIVAYLSGRTVLNLSGAVNNPAADAIRRRRLLDYVRSAGVHFFVDFESSIEAFGRYWGGDPRSCFKRVATLPGWWRGGAMTVFRVQEPSS